MESAVIVHLKDKTAVGIVACPWVNFAAEHNLCHFSAVFVFLISFVFLPDKRAWNAVAYKVAEIKIFLQIVRNKAFEPCNLTRCACKKHSFAVLQIVFYLFKTAFKVALCIFGNTLSVTLFCIDCTGVVDVVVSIKICAVNHTAHTEYHIADCSKSTARCGVTEGIFVFMYTAVNCLFKSVFLTFRIDERTHHTAEIAVDTKFGVNHRVKKAFSVGFHCDSVLWAVALAGCASAAVFFGKVNLFHKKTP